MRRHSPNTINHTDCTCRTTAGGRNRYARAVRHATGAASGYKANGVQPNRAAQSRCESGSGALFSFHPIGSDAADYRASQRRHRFTTSRSFDRSAPVFSIVWFTRGSNDASAARGCAAEFGRTSRAVPTERLFSRLAKCGVPFGGGRFRRAAVHGGASDFSDRRTAAPIHGSVPHLRRTPIVPAANDHSPTGTGMTGTPPENPVSETVLRPMNPDFTTVLTASQNANGCAGRIVSRGRNTHAAARWPRRIRGAFEEPNHLAPHEDRPSATEASPSNDRMRLSSIFHRIVADNDTQSLNLEVTPFISGVSSATSCFEFEDKKNGRIGRPSEHTAGTHVGPMPFSGAVLSCLFHTTASNEESPSVRRPDESSNASEAVVRHGTDLGTSTLSGSRRMPRSTPPGSVPSSGGRSPNRRGGMARHP